MKEFTAQSESLGATSLAAIHGLAISANAPLKRCSTLRVGGPAELFAEIGSERALIELLAEVRHLGVPLHLLGMGSNVLIPDEGLAGVVARLGKPFRRVRLHDTLVVAGAALPLAQLARRTAVAGLKGLEALSGFPSTVGGAVFMNAGCYGTEVKDVLVRATVIGRDGVRRRMSSEELEPAYRSTKLKETGGIVTKAAFRLERGSSAEALARIEELNQRRWRSLPSGKPNAGSIFRNPADDHAGRLIEACGLKGKVLGGAQISGKHANVIVNLGNASAEDIFALMKRAADAVQERFGITLEPEIVLTGSLVERWRELVADSP